MNKILSAILLIALISRLYNIDYIISGWHSWRQSDTAAIARNFSEEEMNIAYPRVDWRGNTSGYVESEFQLYPFIVALIYKVFGTKEIFGRILSLVCALITIIGLYCLVKDTINKKTGLWSAFIYSILPLNIFYGRSFMPEQMMLMFSVLGLYYFLRWIKQDNLFYYFLSVMFISLAALIKLPALYLGLPLLYMSWMKFNYHLFKQPLLWIYAIVVLTLNISWYYHAHILKEITGLSFGIWEGGKDKWGNLETILSLKYYNDIIFKSLAERHFTYPIFLLFLVGLFLKRKNKEEGIFDYWIMGVVLYFFIVARGNQVHEYYQLPLILPGVVFVSKVFSRYDEFPKFFKSIRINYTIILGLLLSLAILLSVLRLVRIYGSEQYDTPLMSLSKNIDPVIGINDLVITVSNGNPVILYNIKRKGWICYIDDISSTYINQKINQGAQYLVGESSSFDFSKNYDKLNYLKRNYHVVEINNNYFIVKL